VRKSVRRARLPWPELREQFIQRRLAGEAISLAAFAEEVGCDRRTLERRSASEGWIAELGAINRARIVERLRYLNLQRAGFRTR
jgi:hypothetical protein